ncbi:MAG: hypothetical protein LBF16_00765 [Pseudomonadales bacterium]|jgi:hypothetical protein|nr:hypothetical protein [Pseudomonadales bacterium]
MNPTTHANDAALWIALADLFFLDTEPDEADFKRVAALIKAEAWTRKRVETTLVQWIAPQVAGNLFSVAGVWAGFDSAWLVARVRRSQALRAKRPAWHFLLADWYYGRIIRTIGISRLLVHIDP